MILSQLFESPEDDFDSEAKAYKLAQQFARWIQTWNEDVPIRDKMSRNARGPRVMYYTVASSFDGPRDLYMGFSYAPGDRGGQAYMVQGRDHGDRMPLYYVMITLDYDPGDTTDIMYKLSWEMISQHLVHELTHYFDRRRQKTPTLGQFNQKVKPVSSADPVAYYNSPLEFNAYFQQGLHNVASAIVLGSPRQYFRLEFNPKSVETFEKFKLNYEQLFDWAWREHLTPENKNKFNRRLYKLWEVLVKKISDQTLRGQEPISLPDE